MEMLIVLAAAAAKKAAEIARCSIGRPDAFVEDIAHEIQAMRRELLLHLMFKSSRVENSAFDNDGI